MFWRDTPFKKIPSKKVNKTEIINLSTVLANLITMQAQHKGGHIRLDKTL
ncbi:MAG: hypothetical protein UU73_C0001G0011 [Candidatus Daviesbacteria bacterium GW2011_GWA1_41_61]|uniref:Uncharacterized protein n=1 Tax=Candidatus Daviesbacteria bacterium GW2011_GWA2_40_9 TaxID=1618424 RepID=A0A0G0X5I2_9BACT|nr:MAG: hypothetical protein UU29_C0008G0011 [Candidatus Daviesbacteria bacterium GW2011_GWA2_40_9]KKR92830.1 MAG: hypothetical protein UU44_C0004G0012 [Candidatus Daviesbacteria bacterium GW2011_GWB1_41_15]KKS15374.1 MAG: hypothetical protein UU73_C0001G0011 [Candidatus Daviesbacteria bacterium GW2011_GWA1_41_61]